MIVIIAGGRDFNDYALFERKCKSILRGLKNVEIMEGEARGADYMAKRFALENGYKLHKRPVLKEEWEMYGRAAPCVGRNERMAREGRALIAFWNGMSPGTKDMIQRAQDYNLQVRVVKVKY